MPTEALTQKVSIQQAAEKNGVSDKTIRRMIADGRIPAVRVGRQIRIDVTALDAAFHPVTEVRA